MHRNQAVFGFGIVFGILTILFVGQYYDLNDGDRIFFIKYRPSWQQFFHASHPYNKTFETTVDRQGAAAFEEFVVDSGLLRKNNPDLFLPVMLIQLTLTLLSCSIWVMLTKALFQYWKLIIHFLIQLPIATFAIIYVSLEDNWVQTMSTGLVLGILNFGVIILLQKLRHSKLGINR